MGGLSEEAIMALTSLYMRRTDTATTSLSVDLTMYDPFSYYVVGEVWVWEAAGGQTNAIDAYEAEQDGNLEIRRMSVAPSDTNVLFTDLKPDTAYNVAFGYYTDTASGAGSRMTASGFVQTDYTTVRTAVENTWLRVDSISMNSMMISLKVDETGEIPDKVSVYVVEIDEPDENLINEGLYNGTQADLTVTSGTTIREMKMSGGAGLSLTNLEIFLGETTPVEYVAVIAVGEYTDPEQSSVSSGIIAGQIVRNPYYGMGIAMDEDGNIILTSGASTTSLETYSADLQNAGARLTELEADVAALAEKNDGTEADAPEEPSSAASDSAGDMDAANERISELESRIEELSSQLESLSGNTSPKPEESPGVSREELDAANERISELEEMIQSIGSQSDSSESEE